MLGKKIARTLAVVAMGSAPFVMFAPTASAAGGCTVDNTATSGTVHVEVTAPPPAVTAEASNVECSYVSQGGAINYGCTVTGRCEVYRNGVQIANCTTAGGCSGTAPTQASAGDVITLRVFGGRGFVADAV